MRARTFVPCATTMPADATPANPHNILQRWLGRTLLRAIGWRVVGQVPATQKYMLLCYPHTSNVDFFLMLAISWVMGFDASWIGKDTLFRFPFGGLARRLGGIPVIRNQQKGQVEQVVARFAESSYLIIAIAPEGSRKLTAGWKTGFYHIAVGAGVPLQLGFLDYQRKIGGFGPLVWPTGDQDRDIETMSAFYRDIVGKFPAQASGVRFTTRSKAA